VVGLGGCNERVGAVRRSCLKSCCLKLLRDSGLRKVVGIVTRAKVVASTIPAYCHFDIRGHLLTKGSAQVYGGPKDFHQCKYLAKKPSTRFLSVTDSLISYLTRDLLIIPYTDSVCAPLQACSVTDSASYSMNS
jgi:hypothetical protein